MWMYSCICTNKLLHRLLCVPLLLPLLFRVSVCAVCLTISGIVNLYGSIVLVIVVKPPVFLDMFQGGEIEKIMHYGLVSEETEGMDISIL